ncbi:MAG: hypothetical protein NVSMB17_19590 [Candidatus Dormibacteria bacterium]
MAVDKLTSWRLGVTPGQMREVDRLAEADYGIKPVQLMEVAGLQTARAAREILGPLAGRAVCILAGKGNNGGDGLVAARRLAGWGAEVRVVTAFEPSQAAGLAVGHVKTLRRQGVPVEPWGDDLPVADLYIDALLGFGAVGAPRGRLAEMISALPAGQPVLALDLPSGLDAQTGETLGASVTAGATVTLAAPKVGMVLPAAAARVGTLYLADIGVPPRLLLEVGVDPSGMFEHGDLEVINRP